MSHCSPQTSVPGEGTVLGTNTVLTVCEKTAESQNDML